MNGTGPSADAAVRHPAPGGGSAGDGLAGWRWRVTLALLAAAALVDLALAAGSGNPLWLPVLLLFVAVAATALRALRRGGDALFATAVRVAALSLAGSAVVGILALGSTTTVGFGFVEGTALTLLLVACWRRATGRRQQAVTGAVALAVVALPARLGLGVDTVTIEALAIAVVAVAVATGSVLRATDSSHHAAVTAVRRAEREEVARELHDVVAHHVTGMVVLTQAARTVASRPSGVLVAAGGAVPPTAPNLDDALAAVEHAGAEALASLRSMVTVLRRGDSDGPGGTPLEPTPTVDDLDDVVRRFRGSGAAERVELVVAPAVRALPPQVQAAAHRVVQESLTNASRYARGARHVLVDLDHAGGRLLLTVCDSGGRAEEAPGAGDGWGGGFGVVGMRERVAALGGTLTAGPGPGGAGWTVRAEVPA